MTSSPRPVARGLRPLRDFLATESAGGVVLLVAAFVALVWANSPWGDTYTDVWSTELSIGIGSRTLSMDLQHWINDGLMTLFFFVVGLEIKRELVEGELRAPRAAALPACAALGGMVVPALLYLALNRSGDASQGWGIPMATDIAVAVGVLSLFSRRVPASLKLFLLALAIVDDIGAIVVIAVFYSSGIELGWLALAVGVIGVMGVLRLLRVTYLPPYVVLGVVSWFAVFQSGVHATIDGVVLGLLAPAQPWGPRAAATFNGASVSLIEYVEHTMHRWSSFVAVPLFALANAGVDIGGDALSSAISSPVTHGVVLGLVVGKFVGIVGFAWLAQRLRVAVLPLGVGWREMLAVSAIGGIGFTVSLFVASLAFDGALLDQAKIGILAGSLGAALIGSALLLRLPVRGIPVDGGM